MNWFISHLYSNRTIFIGLYGIDLPQGACSAAPSYFPILYNICYQVSWKVLSLSHMNAFYKGEIEREGVDRNGVVHSGQCLDCPAAPCWGQAVQSLIFRQTLQNHRSVLSGVKWRPRTECTWSKHVETMSVVFPLAFLCSGKPRIFG